MITVKFNHWCKQKIFPYNLIDKIQCLFRLVLFRKNCFPLQYKQKDVINKVKELTAAFSLIPKVLKAISK